MKKNNKVIIIVLLIIVIIAIITLGIFLVIQKNKSNIIDLKDEEYTKELENVYDEYVDNDSIIFDENGNIKNYSNELSIEKFLLDKKVGMYGFNVKNNDVDETTVTFTVKNHTNEQIEPFKYVLQFMNADDTIKGTINLETQKLPALGKYNVTVHLSQNVIDIYNIVPVSEGEYDQVLGGGVNE